jgi:hypothetical protein
MTRRPPRPPPDEAAPAPDRKRQLRDAALLAASGLVIVLAGSAAPRTTLAEPTPPASASVIEPAPSLPAGAEPPTTAVEEVHLDDEGVGCSFPDRGFGDYERWRALPLGKVLVPPARAVRDDGTFSLLVHFHGAEPVRKELAPEGMDLVIAALDAGAGSSKYDRALAKDGTFEAMIGAIEREVRAATGRSDARVGHLAISSWSAGYGAVGQVLARPHERLEALVLLDSLYAGYKPGKRALEHGQVAPFVRAARTAAEGGPLFYLTTTDIDTDGYASSSETADFLLRELGAKTTDLARAAAAEELTLLRSFDRGALFVRGYAGKGKGDHCAQLRLLPGILRRHVLPGFAP